MQLTPTPSVAAPVAGTLLDRFAIDRRFNGPRSSANGGYAAGRFAAAFGSSARVVLRRRVPLARTLEVRADGCRGARVRRGPSTVAEIDPMSPSALEPPLRLNLADAEAASDAHPWADVRHAFSDCVTCGPRRRDGLGVTPGPVPGRPDLLAAVLHTHSGLARADDRDLLAPEFVWAALDCPSYPAVELLAGRVCLLGTIAVERRREVAVGESLVAVGWTVGRGTRSIGTAAVLLDGDGDVVARAENVWVAARRVSRVRGA